MYLVTLEGLPHSGKGSVLHQLAHACPDWTLLNVAHEPGGASCSWASVGNRSGYALFGSLLRKMRAVQKSSGKDGVVLLNVPWNEPLPRHPAIQVLLTDVTREVASCLGCTVDKHIMVFLRVCPDETFEQMVCAGNPVWNGTTLDDVRATQDTIAEGHPFPYATHCITCPRFFEENEVVTQAIARDIADAVHGLQGLQGLQGLKPSQQSHQQHTAWQTSGRWTCPS